LTTNQPLFIPSKIQSLSIGLTWKTCFDVDSAIVLMDPENQVFKEKGQEGIIWYKAKKAWGIEHN
jgi:hypothetical protein